MTPRFSAHVLRTFPEPTVEQAWREGLSRMKFAAHYNAPEFFKEPYFVGKRPFAVLALDGNAVVGVLTGNHAGDESECGQSARPQICIAEGTDRIAAVDALARGLLDETRSTKLVSVFSWTLLEGMEQHGFRPKQLEGNVVLDLSLGPTALFKQFNKKRRTNIRLAMREGVEVFQASTPRDIGAYYEVYCEWRRTPRKKIEGEQVSLEVFERALALTANRKAFLARHAGKIIAGITLRMYPRGLLEYAAGCAVEENLRLRPNDLLQWRAIEWACTEGFAAYCLGGAHRFLREFGGDVAPIYRYRLDRTFLRRIDRREALFDWARESLHRLPGPVERATRRLLRRP